MGEEQTAQISEAYVRKLKVWNSFVDSKMTKLEKILVQKCKDSHIHENATKTSPPELD